MPDDRPDALEPAPRRAGEMSRRALGRWLILAGVGVWLVFGIVWLAGAHPHASRFLPFHLAGVIPGVVIARWPRS